jgi:hypothetical protein
MQAVDFPRSLSVPAVESSYELIALVPDICAEIFARFGIIAEVQADGGILAVHRSAKRLETSPVIHVTGPDNIVVVDSDTSFRGRLALGTRNLCILMGNQHALNLQVTMYDDATFAWGRASRTYGCRIWVGDGSRVIVGDDCMFSDDVSIRSTDHHSIVGLDSFEQINRPEDVLIGSHVWLAANVTVTSGVTIGSAAIVGAGSVVTKPIPSAELWAGVPARVLRKNVSWVPSHPATAGDIDHLKAIIASQGVGDEA